MGKLPQAEAFALAEKQMRGVGRPTLYKPEFCSRMLEFFSRDPYRTETRKMSKGGANWEEEFEVPNPVPTFEKFAHEIGVTRDTLYEWSTALGEDGGLKHPEFSYIYKNALELQENFIVANAMANRFNPAMSIFYLKNKHGYRDKQELDAHITGGIDVGVVSYADALQQVDVTEGEIIHPTIDNEPEMLPSNRTDQVGNDA